MSGRQRVVVIGGGFGGLAAVRRLRGAPLDVLLIDRNNYHLFTPLLYQVASALLDPSEIAYPLRTLLRKIPNAEFLLDDVTGIDLQARVVMTTQGRQPYDYLVLSPGSVSNFFGIPGLDHRAHPLKTLPEALALRNDVLRKVEAARWETDPERRRALLTFAVVGGGPTGIEYAGALAELMHVLRRDYRGLNFHEARIVLLEAASRLLSGFDEKSAGHARLTLERKGIEVKLGAAVKEVTDGLVELADGGSVKAATVVWTAGVEASGLGFGLGRPGKQQQLVVGPTLQLDGHPEVFVLGDLASVEQPDGKVLPMLAPVAMQQGDHVGRALRSLAAGVPVRPFRYTDRGIMATIGRNNAVVELRRFHFRGFVGWVLWLGLHLFLLIGFRSRVVAIVNWAGDYLFYDRPIRLIVRSGDSPDTPRPPAGS
ncbi:MAG TPA: NAD(P)/FAD-dependent oxidoreductase [Candidatus Dormibacteraeota bacterium]